MGLEYGPIAHWNERQGMEKEIKDRFHEGILQEAMRRYGIGEGEIQLLDGFESFMYEFQQDGGDYILRLAHTRRRSVELIQGEVDWINFLAAGGAGVARAVLSRQGKLVEAVEDGRGGQFLATAFVKARGDHPRGAVWTPEFYERYGGALGRIHALSKRYQPADPTWRRPEWDDPIMMQVESLLPPSEAITVARYQELMAHLQALPKDSEGYGLIHQDFHSGNLFVDEEGRITAFDFDDCVYSWYIYDIAMVLFYAALWAEDAAAFTEAFMPRFLQGYRRENLLDPVWLADMPHFLKLREIDLYAIIHRSFDLENLTGPFEIHYMRGRKERLEGAVPVIDFDFPSLARFL
jgi:Ser/Thr protein kinase RdoA (MazF antagonist)